MAIRADVDGHSWVWTEQGLLRGFLQLVALVLVMMPFGLGALALGSATFEVDCRRAAVMQCTLSEEYLFGLAPLRQTLNDVRLASLVELGDEGATVVELSGPEGRIRSSRFSESLHRSKQRALVRAVAARLEGDSFTERRSLLALPFFGFGLMMSLLWLLGLWGLVTTPLRWAWPTRVRVDRGDDELRLRHRRGWPLERRLGRSAVREVRLTRNPGGPFGAFVAKPRADVPPPPLHVVLLLADGEDVRLLNADQTPDASVKAFAHGLARALRCACREPDEGFSRVA